MRAELLVGNRVSKVRNIDILVLLSRSVGRSRGLERVNANDKRDTAQIETQWEAIRYIELSYITQTSLRHHSQFLDTFCESAHLATRALPDTEDAPSICLASSA